MHSMRVWRLVAIALLGALTAHIARAQTAAVPAPPVELRLVLVDINSATPAELTGVRFIGRNRAAAIVKGRPWKHPDELVAKRVMPKKVYDQIKDQLIAK
jgi:competence protein ComEA